MENISVCMIARNEDNHIEECLKRLRPLKFEIVLVDTGSIDRTTQLAEKYTDKIYDFDWCSDFSAARNYSISMASNDWILVIDCDEYMENVNLMEMFALCKNNPDKVGMIKRNNPYTIQGVKSVMTESIGRLFNRKYCHYEGSIHERVRLLDGSQPEYFDVPLTIYHEGYVTESDKRTRATRNLEMLLRDLKKHGADPYRYYQLGRNYVYMNDEEKAIHYFEQGLEMDVDPKFSYVQSMMESYAYCLIDAEDVHRGQEMIEKFYDSYSNRADFVYVAGIVYMKKGMLQKAYDEFEKATTIHVYNRNGASDYRAFYQMGVIKEMQGDKVLAKALYEKCGDFTPALQRMGSLKYVD